MHGGRVAIELFMYSHIKEILIKTNEINHPFSDVKQDVKQIGLGWALHDPDLDPLGASCTWTPAQHDFSYIGPTRFS